jgi:hypothetical protein
MGVVLCATLLPPNERCNSESMRGIMNRFEKETLDLFKAGRKSDGSSTRKPTVFTVG